MRARPSPAGRAAALGGVVGPVVFVAAWSVLGARTDGYSPTADAISRLAASGAATQTAMTAGFLTYGAGMGLFGAALRPTLRGPAWAFATATGLATLGVAATPLGSPGRDSVHGVFAALGYVTLAAVPLAAAAPLADQGRRRWARLSVAAGAAAAVCLAASAAGPRHGLFQRLGLTIVDVWVVVRAIEIRRRRHP